MTELNLSSGYNSVGYQPLSSQATYSGMGGVNTGGANPESAAQSAGMKKAMGTAGLITGVISVIGAMQVAKYQKKTIKAAQDLRKAQRMAEWGDASSMRRRALDRALVEDQFAQAMGGLKREGTALAAEELSQKEYTADELTSRRSLASAEGADRLQTRSSLFDLKAKNAADVDQFIQGGVKSFAGGFGG